MSKPLICRIEDLENAADLDQQTLNVDCVAGELSISNGNGIPLDSLGVYPIYRYTPTTTPGLRARWWDATAGPHLDPYEWAGPADPETGFPLPSANAPTVDTVNNSSNVNDSNSGAGAARYGIISGWVYLPDGTDTWRDNNGNTGELGMVLSAPCCGGGLTEQPGGNHTVNTGGADRTIMDPNPTNSGWHYVYSPQSDASAFGGLDLEYSTDGGTTWANVTVQQSDIPTVETVLNPACEPVPAGWQIEPLAGCCPTVYTPDPEAADPVAPASASPIADNETDTLIRTGLPGVSTDYARADHNHPIRRQGNPGDPVVVHSGTGAMTQALILDRWSDEESYAYEFRCLVDQIAGNGWDFVTIPSIAGFQRPEISAVGTYRISSTAAQGDDTVGTGGNGATPRGPYMGAEALHWSSTQRIYMGIYRRDIAIRTYLQFKVRYTRL